jgi:hypothetical protein
VKGVAFHTVLQQLRALRGPEVERATIDLLEPALKTALDDGSLLPNGWYPIAWYRDLWRAIDLTSHEGPPFIWRMGYASLMADISGIYRPVLRLLSPGTMTELGARYFNRIYDTGKMRVISADDHHVTARFEGCAGFDRCMWLEVLGSIEAFVELTGKEGINVHLVSGGGDADDFAEVVARWQRR